MPGQRYASIRFSCQIPEDNEEVSIWLAGAYRKFTARYDTGGGALPLYEFEAAPFNSTIPSDVQKFTYAINLKEAIERVLVSLGASTLYSCAATPDASFGLVEITATVYDPALNFQPLLAPGMPPYPYIAYVEVERLDMRRPLTLQLTATIAACFGSATGSIALAVSGGNASPLTYLWDDGATTVNRTGLATGLYSVTVTEPATGVFEVAGIAVGQNSRIDVAINKIGNNLALTVVGGTGPYTYLWSDGATTRDRQNVPPGAAYSVVVTDSLGCSGQANAVVEQFRYYFAGNAIPLALDAGPAYRANPATKPGLRFVCEVWVELAYLSGTFTSVGPPLEQPVDSQGRTTFEVQELLEPYVETHLPAVGQHYVSRTDGTQFRRFYLKWFERTTAGDSAAVTLDYNYLVAGGLGFVEAGVGTWFSGYQERVMPFLNWEPLTKKVLPDQPEYLYFMVPRFAMTVLRYQVRVTFSDGTTTQFVHTTRVGVLRFEVFCLPAGYDQLGLGLLETEARTVVSYQVFVLDQDQSPASERRTFVLDRRPAATRRYFLYANSLGGMNTLCCRGRAERTLATKTITSDNDRPAGYDPLRGEVSIDRRTGAPLLKCYAGVRSAAQQRADADFALSERVLLLDDGRYLAGVAKDRTFVLDDEDETRRLLQFDYELPRERYFTPRLRS